MNSSETLQSQSPQSLTECDLFIFLGGRLGRTDTGACVVLVCIAILSLVTFPIVTVLNALVIVAIRTKPLLKTMSNIALGCLATTDGITGMIGQPVFAVWILTTLKGDSSSPYCSFQNLSRNSLRVLVGASFFHLVLLNVERYIAIKHSLEYIAMVTKFRILISSSIAWITMSLLTISLTIVDNTVYVTVSNIILCICMTVTVFCQVVLGCETRRHEREITAHHASVRARQKFLKEKKALKVTTIVLLMLVLTYSPILIVRLLIIKSVIVSVSAAYIAFFIATFVLILNSFINPIIYCVRIRQFRVAFMEIAFRKGSTKTEKINFVTAIEEGRKRGGQQHDTKPGTCLASCCYEQKNHFNDENRRTISDINIGNDRNVNDNNSNNNISSRNKSD